MRALIVVFAFLFQNCFAHAFWHGSPAGPTGFAQMNLGGGDLEPANFVNILKVGQIAFSGGATPSTAGLDANGFPTQSFTGLMGETFGGATWGGVSYTLIWTAGTKLPITNAGNNSSCSVSGIGGSF